MFSCLLIIKLHMTMVFVSLASITLSFPSGLNLCSSFNIFKMFNKWGNGQDVLYFNIDSV